MADGDSGAKIITEAIVKPVVNEVGKAIESGVQSVFGVPTQRNPLDPATKQQKQVADAKKRAYWQQYLDQQKQLEAERQKIRQQKNQQQQQQTQEEIQKKQFEQQKKLVKEQQKAQVIKDAQTKTEIKKGVGG